MKQQIFTRSGFLLAVMSVFLSFFACRQDVQVAPVATISLSPSEKISLSKSWFEEYQKTGMVERSSTFKGIQVLWEYAAAAGSMVEVPFLLNGELNFPSLYKGVTKLGKQRLVILDRGAKGKEVYIFDYMPSTTFTTNIEDVHLNFRKIKFNGMLAVHTFDSDSIKGFVWNEGKLTKQLHAKSSGVLLRDCTVETYLYACGRVSIGGSTSALNCSTGIRVVCFTSGSGGGSGDGGIDTSNSGGACNPWFLGCGDKDANEDGDNGRPSNELAPDEIGKTLTNTHVICPNSLTVGNGGVGIRDFNLGIMGSPPYVVAVGDWKIQTNILSGDPYANAIGNLISETFQRVLQLARADLAMRSITTASLAQNGNQFSKNNTSGGPPRFDISLSDFVQENFGPTFRAVTLDKFGIVRTGEVEHRYGRNSQLGYSVPIASNNPSVECP
jgi:hypothetical protein